MAAPAWLGSAVPEARALGQGQLRWLGMPLYDASLWVAPGSDAATLAGHAFALELRYLRAFRGKDIARRSIKEMARAGTFTPAQSREWQAALERLLPDVQPGDRIAGIHLPGRGARFVVNGRPAGEVADPAFAALFFAIWLGPSASQPELRDALLGGGS